MELFALSALAAGVVSLIFGGLVILKDSSELSNRLYFLMSLAISVWGVSYWFWLTNSTNVEQAYIWISILTAGSLLSVMFFTHWVLVVTRAAGFFWSIVLGGTYGVILGFISILVFYPSLLIGAISEKIIFPFWPTAGPLYLTHIILGYVLPVSLALFRIAYRLFLVKAEMRRGQLTSMLAGTLLGFGGGAINFYLWFDIPILPYGNFAIIMFPPLLGYSIIRYRLFTLKTIATELLVLFIVTGVFIQIFTSSSFVNLVVQIAFFVLISIASYLLLQSVYNEVHTRKSLQEITDKLQKANVKLRELDQQKSEFLSIATHQLRGPLAGIRGHLSLIVDGSYGRIPDRAMVILKQIFASSGMLAQTINDFLDVSRIEQGRMDYDMKDLECDELVSEVVQELQPVSKERHLKLSFANHLKKKCTVHADYAKIRHIFFNLIDNAIKYTEHGWVKVHIEPGEGGNTIRIVVSDSGIGIDPKEISKLFEKFVRAEGASGVNVNGTGLGLYVARQMVEAHNGKIWAESQGVGRGSTFIVELPLVSRFAHEPAKVK